MISLFEAGVLPVKNRTGRQSLVFISHANEDNAAAKRLYKRLKDDGFDPWLDEERLLPGQNWSLEIEKALRASDVILLCFSGVSVVKSGFVQKEFKRAMDILDEKPEGAIFVIPIRLDNCEMPHFIRDLHWMDYPDDYDKLLLSLQSRSGVTIMPAKPSTQKKHVTRKPATTAKNSGPIFNIQGDIHIGRDMVAGDQLNIHPENIANINSPTQFTDELRKLKYKIETLKSSSRIDPVAARRMDVVQADIQDAIDEALKEKPTAGRIQTTLSSAKETLDKLGGSIVSASNLGTMLGNLGLMARKIFGG